MSTTKQVNMMEICDYENQYFNISRRCQSLDRPFSEVSAGILMKNEYISANKSDSHAKLTLNVCNASAKVGPPSDIMPAFSSVTRAWSRSFSKSLTSISLKVLA